MTHRMKLWLWLSLSINLLSSQMGFSEKSSYTREEKTELTRRCNILFGGEGPTVTSKIQTRVVVINVEGIPSSDQMPDFRSNLVASALLDEADTLGILDQLVNPTDDGESLSEDLRTATVESQTFVPSISYLTPEFALESYIKNISPQQKDKLLKLDSSITDYTEEKDTEQVVVHVFYFNKNGKALLKNGYAGCFSIATARKFKRSTGEYAPKARVVIQQSSEVGHTLSNEFRVNSY